MQAFRHEGERAAAPSGDDRFRGLFEAHHHDVLRFCLRRIDRHSAYDVAAETFVVAWRRLDDVPGGESALAWLYAVARNLLGNERRSQARRRRLADRVAGMPPPRPEGPDEAVVRSVPDPQLITALRRLRRTDRELLQLVAWEQLSRQEIARLLAISRKALDQRIGRALRRLRAELERQQLEFSNPHIVAEGER